VFPHRQHVATANETLQVRDNRKVMEEYADKLPTICDAALGAAFHFKTPLSVDLGSRISLTRHGIPVGYAVGDPTKWPLLGPELVVTTDAFLATPVSPGLK
jgi:hypothetical protein